MKDIRNYSDMYARSYDLASGARSPKGKAHSVWWYRRKEGTPDVVEVGKYPRYRMAEKKIYPKPKETTAMEVYFELHPTRMIIYPRDHYAPFDPKDYYTNEQIPGIDSIQVRKFRQADISINNFLCPILFHKGAGEHPGFAWLPTSHGTNVYLAAPTKYTRIYGPVLYDAITRTVHPVIAQPELVVKDELRKQLNAMLKPVIKHFRMLYRMGTEITRMEVNDYINANFHTKNEWGTRIIENPHQILKRFDPTSKDSVLRTCAALKALNGGEFVGPWTQLGTEYRQFPFLPNHWNKLRKALHKTYTVRKYEV